jgi:cytochrome c oxidase cbb3-type subunit III
MTVHSRLIAVVVASAWMTGFLVAQGGGAATPQGQAPPTAGPAQTPQPPAAGRGARQGGQRRGGFQPFVRPVASQDVLVRGKALYDANCASCHAPDLRGSATSPNLLRSGVALRDQTGELVTAAVGKHTPAITMVEADTVAIAEYIHSVHATMGGQGSPPGRGATGAAALPVLVGDAKAGAGQFATLCASCHSVAGDLKGIGAKFPDARALQNAWIAGSSSAVGGGGGGGRGGGGDAGNPVTVTMADGSKLEGTLVRKNEFLVVLTLPDGTRRSIARNDGVPRVDVKDPQEAHKVMALKLAFDDPDNSKMHNITAYLSTIK